MGTDIGNRMLPVLGIVTMIACVCAAATFAVATFIALLFADAPGSETYFLKPLGGLFLSLVGCLAGAGLLKPITPRWPFILVSLVALAGSLSFLVYVESIFQQVS